MSVASQLWFTKLPNDILTARARALLSSKFGRFGANSVKSLTAALVEIESQVDDRDIVDAAKLARAHIETVSLLNNDISLLFMVDCHRITQSHRDIAAFLTIQDFCQITQQRNPEGAKMKTIEVAGIQFVMPSFSEIKTHKLPGMNWIWSTYHDVLIDDTGMLMVDCLEYGNVSAGAVVEIGNESVVINGDSIKPFGHNKTLR